MTMFRSFMLALALFALAGAFQRSEAGIVRHTVKGTAQTAKKVVKHAGKDTFSMLKFVF
jgi:hypothetical protein